MSSNCHDLAPPPPLEPPRLVYLPALKGKLRWLALSLVIAKLFNVKVLY